MISQKIYQIYYGKRKDLIDVFSLFYGEENREKISRRINALFFDFSSDPEEEYIYAVNNKKKFSSIELLEIKMKYMAYKGVKKDAEKEALDSLKNLVDQIFPFRDYKIIKSNEELFLSLFAGQDFDMGYVDSYSEDSERLLKRDDVADSIKESIYRDREAFNKIARVLGIDISDIDYEKIDKLIKCRESIKEEYQLYIARRSGYGNILRRSLKEKIHTDPSDALVSYFSFKKDACAGEIFLNGRCDVVPFVKIPFVRMHNDGIKGFDVTIIHELIHKIETNENRAGIVFKGCDEDEMANEIRVQIIAIKITKLMHEKGLFVFDNPKDCVVENESIYEIVFPLFKVFFEKYEKDLMEYAIGDCDESLEKMFGETWRDFSKMITNIHDYVKECCNEYGVVPEICGCQDINEMIKKMSEYYEREIEKNVSKFKKC
jgi:hypothetical protein